MIQGESISHKVKNRISPLKAIFHFICRVWKKMLFSVKDRRACHSDDIWEALRRSPSYGHPSWSSWEDCSPSGQIPRGTADHTGSAHPRRRRTTSKPLRSTSGEIKEGWNDECLLVCVSTSTGTDVVTWCTVLLLIHLADENHHPLLQSEQFIRHPLGLVNQIAGGIGIALKRSLQVEERFDPGLNQY